MRDGPGRDVQNIRAEDGEKLAGGADHALKPPLRIRQVDAQGRADVGKIRMSPPCRDAVQVCPVGVARPPHQVRRQAGEFDDVLTGAATQLEHIAGSALQERREDGPNRFVISMEGRGVQTAIGHSRTLMPAALITGSHFAISDFKCVASSAGVDAITSTPSSCSRALTVGIGQRQRYRRAFC